MTDIVRTVHGVPWKVSFPAGFSTDYQVVTMQRAGYAVTYEVSASLSRFAMLRFVACGFHNLQCGFSIGSAGNYPGRPRKVGVGQ